MSMDAMSRSNTVGTNSVGGAFSASRSWGPGTGGPEQHPRCITGAGLLSGLARNARSPATSERLADPAGHGKTIFIPRADVAGIVVLGPSRLSAKSCGKASKPPSGADWVHEIKHDGYRLIVRRDGPAVRLYSRNAYDWTVRLSAIAAAADRTKAKSFTIDGEAVMLGPDGLSRFEELSPQEATHTAILYAFDLIEHDGDDMRNR
jgi:ATP dependent DNA ligase domain